MAAALGIFNPQTTAGQALAGGVLKPMSSSTTGGTSSAGSSSSAGGSSATITANDFLTLLVTEMKNQDPTATTDPNEYINQLVQVNSLQQLISINETLTGALSVPSTASSSGASGQAASASSLLSDPGSTGATKAAHASTPANAANGNATAVTPAAIAASRVPHIAAVAGNIGVPAASPAAARVASALSGHADASPIASGIAGLR